MRAARIIVGFFTGLCIIFLGDSAQGASAAPLPECGAVGADGSVLKANLKLEAINGGSADRKAAVSFKDERGTLKRVFDFALEDCQFSAERIGGDLLVQFRSALDTDGNELEAKISGSGRIKGPTTAVVTFSVDPAANARPGDFESGFVVLDEDVNIYKQPITVSLAFGQRLLLFLAVLVPILIVGPALIWYKGRAGGSTESLVAWFKKAANLFSVAVGAFAVWGYLLKTTFTTAGFGVELYDSDWYLWFLEPDYLTALTGAGAAFVAATLSASVVGDKLRGGTNPIVSSAGGSLAGASPAPPPAPAPAPAPGA